MKPLQIEILKLLSSNDVPDAELLKIKRLLIKALSGKIDEAVDKMFKEKKWDEKRIKEWSKLHIRTSYK